MLRCGGGMTGLVRSMGERCMLGTQCIREMSGQGIVPLVLWI